MERRQKKSLIRLFFVSRLFLAGALVLSAVVGFGYARAYYQDYQIKQEIRELEQEVERLKTKKLESLDILKYVTSDAFVEEKARTELNMRKPGEQLVIIEREEDTSAVSMEEDVLAERAESNPAKWLRYFFSAN